MNRFITAILVVEALVLTNFISNGSAEETRMEEADNFVVSAETNKDIYRRNEKIKIYAKIENFKKDQYIRFFGLTCQYSIFSFDGKGGVDIFELNRPEDDVFIEPNSTFLHFIADYSQLEEDRLSPGQYYVSVYFFKSINFFPDIYPPPKIFRCGGTKIITILKY